MQCACHRHEMNNSEKKNGYAENQTGAGWARSANAALSNAECLTVLAVDKARSRHRGP